MQGTNKVEFVAGFGVAQKGYSDIGLKAVDIKMILSDALYDDTKFNRLSVLENSLDEVCKKSIYTPIKRYINTDLILNQVRVHLRILKNYLLWMLRTFQSALQIHIKNLIRLKD